ncbi:hypothetical protein CRM22_000823 [Opisthorchis felineus]|uniref:Microtubule-associated protein 1A/B/S-like MBL-like domain-containing protein n=1 Tax=Opisthorchis felineus TaxID=147828 RepID=A0A4S2MJJ1_OPIFE|nr:hypothetical protein CRM22_000823 [Opisthorchis felineus]
MAVARILVVIGEVLAEHCKENLCATLAEGFSTLPPEALRHLQEKLPELPDHSEKFAVDDALFLQRNGSDIAVSLLFRPSATTIATAIKNLLVPPSKPELGASAVVIYAGLVSEGSGHWLLPDFVCTPSFVEDEIEEIISAYPKPVDIENLPPHKRILLHIGVGGIVSGGDWKQLPTRRFDSLSGHPLAISVNATHPPSKQKPTASGDSATAAVDYTDLRNLVDSLISELPESCCPLLATALNPRGPTDQTLRVSRPCLYVFPEGSGQSAILTLPGYSMLIDSGCSHRPNFWPVATYLDRLDSVFVTHWGVDNLLGMRAVLPVAFETNPALPDSQQPLLCLLTPPPNPANAFQFPEPHVNRSPFSLSLPRQLAELMSTMKQNGTRLTLYPVTRGAKLSSTSQPIQLYKKIGQGTLELHALTPTDEDTAELRKLNDDWAKASPALMSTPVNSGKMPPANRFSVPLLSHTSVSGLVLWRPARDTDPVLRVLFVSPNAHQTRILFSLEAVVAANICLRHSKAVLAELERKRPVTAPPRRPTVQQVRTTKTPSVCSANSLDLKATGKSAPSHPSVRKESGPSAKNHERSSVSTKGATTTEKVASTPNANPLANPTAAETNSSTENGVVAVAAQPNGNANGFHLTHDHDLTPDLNKLGLHDGPPRELLQTDAPSDASFTGGHASLLDDPVAVWGVPQGLPVPAPPIGPTHDAKSATDKSATSARRLTSVGSGRPVASARGGRSNETTSPATGPGYSPGCTDASAHAIGPGGAKLPPYDKVKPVYVDISFLPGGGNAHLVDAEWFKRVRARYYVATDPKPSVALMEAIVIGKESWTGEDAKLPVSVVFAHESEELIIWLGRNAGRLHGCHLDVAAIASRSSIQLMSEPHPIIGGPVSSQPLTCAGYRIDL